MAKEGPTRYEVVVMDLVLEGILHGIDLAAAFRRELPETRLIVLSADRRRAMVEASLQAGASAYVTKSDTLDALKAAIAAVREGRTYLAPELASVTNGNGNGNGNGHRETGPSLRLLSPRERQVLTLIARGGTTKSIASDSRHQPQDRGEAPGQARPEARHPLGGRADALRHRERDGVAGRSAVACRPPGGAGVDGPSGWRAAWPAGGRGGRRVPGGGGESPAAGCRRPLQAARHGHSRRALQPGARWRGASGVVRRRPVPPTHPLPFGDLPICRMAPRPPTLSVRPSG